MIWIFPWLFPPPLSSPSALVWVRWKSEMATWNEKRGKREEAWPSSLAERENDEEEKKAKWVVTGRLYLNESTSQKVVIIFQPTSLFPTWLLTFFFPLVSLSTEIHGQLVESDALMAHHDLFFPKWDGTKIESRRKKERKKNSYSPFSILPIWFFRFILRSDSPTGHCRSSAT